MHKPGWQETHTFQKKLLKDSAISVIISGDFTAAGRADLDMFKGTTLRMYLIWISVAIALRMSYGEQDISLQHTTSILLVHFDTNNVDQNQPKDIAVGIIKIAKISMNKYPKINIIITGVLPRN